MRALRSDIVQHLGDTRRNRPTVRGYCLAILAAFVLAAVASFLTGLLGSQALIDLAEAAVFSAGLAFLFIWAARRSR
jgi:hypothetical protein